MKESPRWLLTKGLYEQANEVIAVIAKTNKKEIPAGYLTKLQEDVSFTIVFVAYVVKVKCTEELNIKWIDEMRFWFSKY